MCPHLWSALAGNQLVSTGCDDCSLSLLVNRVEGDELGDLIPLDRLQCGFVVKHHHSCCMSQEG